MIQMNDTRVLKVFEDRQIQLKLTEQQKKDILEMKTIIGENNCILQADGKLLIRHYVGFVQINKTRLLIYPKIANGIREKEEIDKAFGVLIKLLCYSNFVGIKEINTPQFIGKYSGDLLEVFLGIFINQLLFLYKREVNRGYVSTIENQSFIKGKIDFTESIQKNTFKRHLHYVEYDEFSENMLMNRIFKTVVLNLIVRTNVNENKRKLKQALLWMEDVEPISLNSEIWNKVTFTRLNKDYKTVFHMAKLLYYNSSPNLNKGDELTFSFLVPLNQLFERYVYEIIRTNVEPDRKVIYQGPQKYLGIQENKNKFLLKPDISILKDEKVDAIIDAKYKQVCYQDSEMKISQSDIYQMLAYSMKYQCQNIVLAYPKYFDSKNDNTLLSTIEIPIENQEDFKTTIKVIQVDLEKDADEMGRELMNQIYRYY